MREVFAEDGRLLGRVNASEQEYERAVARAAAVIGHEAVHAEKAAVGRGDE